MALPPSPASFQDAGRAAYALRLCGFTFESKQAFRDSYQIAMEIDLPRHAQFSAWQLALMALEAGEHTMAAEWTGILADLFKSEDDEISSSFVVGFFCRTAIAHGDRASALHHFEHFQLCHPRFPTLKSATYLVALELGVMLLTNDWIPSDAMLEVAKNRFQASARFGTSDFFCAVYCEALLRAGKNIEAREILSDYLLNLRRDRSALAENLLELAKTINFNSLP
jgi:hypothetical protein